MLSALVTTVRPALAASARATSVVVVPPVSADTSRSGTRSPAARAMRCFSSRIRPVR